MTATHTFQYVHIKDAILKEISSETRKKLWAYIAAGTGNAWDKYINNKKNKKNIAAAARLNHTRGEKRQKWWLQLARFYSSTTKLIDDIHIYIRRTKRTTHTHTKTLLKELIGNYSTIILSYDGSLSKATWNQWMLIKKNKKKRSSGKIRRSYLHCICRCIENLPYQR